MGGFDTNATLVNSQDSWSARLFRVMKLASAGRLLTEISPAFATAKSFVVLLGIAISQYSSCEGCLRMMLSASYLMGQRGVRNGRVPRHPWQWPIHRIRDHVIRLGLSNILQAVEYPALKIQCKKKITFEAYLGFLAVFLYRSVVSRGILWRLLLTWDQSFLAKAGSERLSAIPGTLQLVVQTSAR